MPLPPKNPLVVYPMPSLVGVGTRNGWGGPFAWTQPAAHLVLTRIDDLPVDQKAEMTVARARMGWS